MPFCACYKTWNFCTQPNSLGCFSSRQHFTVKYLSHRRDLIMYGSMDLCSRLQRLSPLRFGSSTMYFTWLVYENAFFWKYCLFTSLARTVVYDLTVRRHWSFNASDAEGAREMYTPRVGEKTACDSPLPSPTAPPTPLCWFSFDPLHSPKSN